MVSNFAKGLDSELFLQNIEGEPVFLYSRLGLRFKLPRFSPSVPCASVLTFPESSSFFMFWFLSFQTSYPSHSSGLCLFTVLQTTNTL